MILMCVGVLIFHHVNCYIYGNRLQTVDLAIGRRSSNGVFGQKQDKLQFLFAVCILSLNGF